MKPGTVAEPEGDLRSVEGWKPHDFITVCPMGGGGRTVMASGIFVCAVASCSGMHPNTAQCMAGLVSRGLNNATEMQTSTDILEICCIHCQGRTGRSCTF